MWNNQKSVLLSQLSVLLFSAALFAVLVYTPTLVRWLIDFSRAELQGMEIYFFFTIYIGSMPAALLLYSLYRLLKHISSRQMFLPENVGHLRHISWCCYTGAVVCFISALYYFPWLVIAVPAGFMGLIVRVIKNVVALGVELQHEADYTV